MTAIAARELALKQGMDQEAQARQRAGCHHRHAQRLQLRQRATPVHGPGQGRVGGYHP